MKYKLNELLLEVLDNRGKNPPFYSLNGIPVIDNALIQTSRYPIISEKTRYIDCELAKSFLRDNVIKDDVLITLVGNGYGNCCLCPENVAIIQNTIGLRFKKELIMQRYAYYLLFTHKSKIKLLNRGASQPSIKISDLKDLDFDIPSIISQEHIVNTISTLSLISL